MQFYWRIRTDDGEFDGERGRRSLEGELAGRIRAATIVINGVGFQRADDDVVDVAGAV